MPFDFASYLSVASYLSQANNEESFRSSISRSYYAAFNKAKRYALAGTPRLTIGYKENAHEKVAIWLQANHHHNQVGDWLMELRRMRNNADYDDNLKPGKVRSVQVNNFYKAQEAALALAKDIITNL